MTVYDQLQRALTAEGIDGSVEHVLLVLRMHDDTAHLSIRRTPSEADARQWLESEGRRFREPVSVLRREGTRRPCNSRPRG